MVTGAIKAADHVNPASAVYKPFMIGDVAPDGTFIHVFDRTGLDLVLHELDTISDFVTYLAARAEFIRSGRLLWSPNEASLLANYLQHHDDHGRHAFPQPSYFGVSDDYTFTFGPGEFEALSTSGVYRAKKDADRISYVWDKLIGAFTEHILAGTSVAALGEEPSAARAEPALRIMAREKRIARRYLGGAFFDALEKAKAEQQDRFVRTMMPFSGMADAECGYVFMILSYPTEFKLEDGYDQYRRTRATMLEAHCAAVLYDHRSLKRMVGIAIDASGSEINSEDLVAVEINEWNLDLERRVEAQRAHFKSFDASRHQMTKTIVEEYPSKNPKPKGTSQKR